MDIIPAIDIKDGKCVRLFQGNYSKEKVFGNNLLEIASKWIDLGAKRLHIVDLDGAKHFVPELNNIPKKYIHYKKVSRIFRHSSTDWRRCKKIFRCKISF